MMLGLIALPQMLRLGYDRKLSMGAICAGGSLATLIPPSIVMVIYGVTANVSIGALFLGGVFPGLMLAGFYVAYILLRVRMNPSLAPPPAAERREVTAADKLAALRGIAIRNNFV